MAILRTYMISAFAKLVMSGTWTLDQNIVTEDVKLVPELYQEKVAEWLVEHAG